MPPVPPPDVRVSYPAVLLSVVALDTSAPWLDSPPTPTALAAPLWAQSGFRLLRLPRGAPRPPPQTARAGPSCFPRGSTPVESSGLSPRTQKFGPSRLAPAR